MEATMIDANEWFGPATSFDTAKDELLKLVQKAQEVSESLIANWQKFHPTEIPFPSKHRPFQIICRNPPFARGTLNGT